jgi:hypothetical protein
MTLDHLTAGALNGAIFAIVAVAVPRASRHILAAVLVAAAALYVAFTLDAHTSAAWLAVELAGVGLYGALAVRGLRGSAWWLVAGWALHPVWDVALHLVGPANAFAPAWYATSCLAFDLAVAGFTAIAILVGTHLSDAPVPKPTPAPVPLTFAAPCACGARAA